MTIAAANFSADLDLRKGESMRVLVTGAGGNLGRATLPALAADGHTPVGFDFRPVATDFEFIQGDVRNPGDLFRAATDCDAIVHAAALHGIHLGKWTSQAYWAINAQGTFNVYEAAREHGISRVVLSSSMGVYGKSLEPTAEAWAFVTEDKPLLPQDVYGFSKVLCEEMASYFARVHDVSSVALRFGMYVPATFEHYGFRLLFGGVDERDVAQSVLLSLTHQPSAGVDFFNIMADTPFLESDCKPLHQDAVAVLERYWPGSRKLFQEKDIDPSEHLWGRAAWPVTKAKTRLGYHPEWNFDRFLEAVREDDAARYPFIGLPHWGV
jgi:nucleoside-diphosphate-sugar epimerase